MDYLLRIFLLMLATTLIGGCSYFTPPLERPVIEDKLGPSLWGKDEVIGTLSLTPERRVVLVNFKTKRFCAEAPTEVGLDLSKILNASGSASATSQGSVALGLLIGSSNSNSVLNKRSQAIQLFLANSYYTCQMYLNGAISGEQLVELQLETLKNIAPILANEIPFLYATNEPVNNPNYVPLDINSIIEKLFNGTVQTSEQEDAQKALEAQQAQQPESPAE